MGSLYTAPDPRLDVTDASAVDRCVAQCKPDVIINAAAYTAVDKAETDEANAYAVNETGVVNLATACKSQNAHMVHVSTDFVFGECKPTPLKPDTDVDPVSVYGKSKLAGETAIVKASARTKPGGANCLGVFIAR